MIFSYALLYLADMCKKTFKLCVYELSPCGFCGDMCLACAFVYCCWAFHYFDKKWSDNRRISVRCICKLFVYLYLFGYVWYAVHLVWTVDFTAFLCLDNGCCVGPKCLSRPFCLCVLS